METSAVRERPLHACVEMCGSVGHKHVYGIYRMPVHQR